MSEPEPTYPPYGEQLDPPTVESLRRTYESMRADGISIVRTAEKGLRSLGIEPDTAVTINTRAERRAARRQ